MKNKKLSASMLLIAGAALVACGGGTSTETKVTLTLWEDDTNIEMLGVVAEEFSAWYAAEYPLAPRVEVNFIPESEGKSISNLILDGPSGNGPDIVAFVHDTLGTAVNNGLLSEVPYTSQIQDENTPESVAAFTYDDTLYAYPYVAESITVMYDKTKLSASDLVSFDSLLASGKKIALTMSGDGSGYYGFGVLNDTVLFGEDGTEADNLDLATDGAVHNLHSLCTTYASTIVNTDPDTALALMGTGEVDGIVTSPYLWDSVKENLGTSAGLAVLPSINGEAQRPFSGFKGYGVSKYSKNPTIAHLFAKYLTSEDTQYYRYFQKGYLPTYVGSSRIDDAIAADDEASVFKASLANSLPMPNILAMADYWSPMQDAMTEIWNGGSSMTEDQIRQILVETTSTILS